MRLLNWMAAGIVAGACVVVSIDKAAVAAKACTEWDGLKAIRGHCPEDYVRLDIIDERAEAAILAATERYFPLDFGVRGSPDHLVQVRHSETPSRSRQWRGEFLIVVQDRGSNVTAELTRPQRPIRVEVHRIVHEKHYKLIAQAFAQSTLSPQDPLWAEQVRRILPAVEAIVGDVRIERARTDDEACPALKMHVTAVKSLLPEPLKVPKPDQKPEEPETVSIYLHPQRYDVVLADYPRVIYVSEVDSDAAFFKWAEGTVRSLEPCWKPLSNADK